MDERDSLSFSTNPRSLIDQTYAGGPTALESAVQVVDGKTDVVDSRAPCGYEFANWGGGIGGLEQLDEGVSSGEPDDPGSVGIIERDLV